MSTEVYGLIEIVAFFGGVMAFGIWQLRSLKKTRAEDAEKAERAARGEAEPDPDPDAKPTKEDVFWREMTRPKKTR